MAPRAEPFTLFDYPQQENPDLVSCLLYKQLRAWARAYYRGLDPADACYVASKNKLYRSWVEAFIQAEDLRRNAAAVNYVNQTSLARAFDIMDRMVIEQPENAHASYLAAAGRQFNTLHRAACIRALFYPADAEVSSTRLYLKGPGLQETVHATGQVKSPRKTATKARSPLWQSMTMDDVDAQVAEEERRATVQTIQRSSDIEDPTCTPEVPVPDITITPPSPTLAATQLTLNNDHAHEKSPEGISVTKLAHGCEKTNIETPKDEEERMPRLADEETRSSPAGRVNIAMPPTDQQAESCKQDMGHAVQ